LMKKDDGVRIGKSILNHCVRPGSSSGPEEPGNDRPISREFSLGGRAATRTSTTHDCPRHQNAPAVSVISSGLFAGNPAGRSKLGRCPTPQFYGIDRIERMLGIEIGGDSTLFLDISATNGARASYCRRIFGPYTSDKRHKGKPPIQRRCVQPPDSVGKPRRASPLCRAGPASSPRAITEGPIDLRERRTRARFLSLSAFAHRRQPASCAIHLISQTFPKSQGRKKTTTPPNVRSMYMVCSS